MKIWSRKKLKAKISSHKRAFDTLLILYKQSHIDNDNLLKKLSDVRIKNRNLKKENEKLKKEEQILYDCIQKYYEPTNEKKMIKLIKETEKVFKNFIAVVSNEDK